MDQGVVEGVAEVKRVVKDHFEGRFNKQEIPRPKLTGLEFNRLSDKERVMLEEEFSREEIKEVVFSCKGDRSPRPDGFNLGFIKKCWEIVGNEVVLCIQDFHLKDSLPRALSVIYGLNSQGFKISDGMSYDLLQFADDTILMCEGSWRNLWAIKVVLRGFEMVYGLRESMWKRKFYGIGLEHTFLQETYDKKGVAWISWKKICKRKDEGGLGIKDMEMFNKALLSKCLWRFLSGENAIWKGVLKVKYDVLADRILLKKRPGKKRLESLLWKGAGQGLRCVSSMGSWVDNRWLWHIEGNIGEDK
ncbi:unnamed protein product [Vicia faba]|uniref:Uncharacterized protein n=1 Tax=Vicia faba TaxID=3906 RepID=A0AAV0ZWB2_VICFA|nr:unnamed protein product [Vicia faba]